MNRFLKVGVITGCAAVLFSFFAPAEINAQALPKVLARMDRHYKKLSSLGTSIKMDKFNVQLNEHDLYEGTLTLLPKKKDRGMYARIDWKRPRVENIAVIGNRFQYYVPHLNQVHRGEISARRVSPAAGGAFAFWGMSAAELKQNYRIDLIGREKLPGGIKAHRLSITPLKTTNYRKAELWVDRKGMIHLVKVTENNSDTTRISLYNIRKNKKVDAKEFTINIPKGVKVIKG